MMAARVGRSRFRSCPLAELPTDLRGGVVALGNFDGVHRGHVALLRSAIAEARRLAEPAIAVTFEPHTRNLFHPASPVFRLTPLVVKERILATVGMDAAVVVPFDEGLATLSAEEFVERILVGRLAAGMVVVGYDFHFGSSRTGSPEFLTDAGARLGFPVIVVGRVIDENGVAFSATRIREALEEGDIGAANRMLGYRWFVVATVIDGDRRGRELGFPTANMRLGPDCRLRHGIYAVLVERPNGAIHNAVASFGRRPTFDNGAPLLEAYLFDFAGDLYGEELKVTFVDWIRPELRFESVDDLKARMAEDSAAARRILAAAGPGNTLDRALLA